MTNCLCRLSLALALAFAGSSASAQSALPADIANAIRERFGPDGIRYFDSAVDLNDDGKNEVIVYLVGPMVCGTGGCNLLVFSPHGTGYRLVSSISVVQTPVRVSTDRTSGWRDLIVHVSGGGAKSGDVVLAFDGRSYPTNPTVAGPRVWRTDSAARAQIAIDEFKNFTDGKLLPAAGATGVAHGAAPPPGPSFDCAKAATAMERRVCNDPSLASLDRRLAEAYANGLSPRSGRSAADRNAWRARQREWVAERNDCAKESDVASCVESSYRRRLVELQIRNGELGARTAVGYRCEGLGRESVTVAFYRDTDPPSAVVTAGNRQMITALATTASGAKYVARGVELWEHHGEATLEWFGKSYTCEAR
jgi:uncharacterized protein